MSEFAGGEGLLGLGLSFDLLLFVSAWRPRGRSKSVISIGLYSWANPISGTYSSTYNLLTKSPGPPIQVWAPQIRNIPEYTLHVPPYIH